MLPTRVETSASLEPGFVLVFMLVVVTGNKELDWSNGASESVGKTGLSALANAVESTVALSSDTTSVVVESTVAVSSDTTSASSTVVVEGTAVGLDETKRSVGVGQ